MVNTYLYTGPLPLGSVVAHNCGAAGLFSDKVHPEVILEAHEMEGMYTLTVTIGDSVQIQAVPAALATSAASCHPSRAMYMP